MKHHTIFALCAGLALAGCQPTNQGSVVELAAQVPTNYRAQVAEHFRKTLKDPYSVRDAEISQPTTVFVGLLNGGNAPGVCVRMNAKNSFGAYIGLKTDAVVFRNDVVVGSAEPVFDTCTKETFSPFPVMMSPSAGLMPSR